MNSIIVIKQNKVESLGGVESLELNDRSDGVNVFFVEEENSGEDRVIICSDVLSAVLESGIVCHEERIYMIDFKGDISDLRSANVSPGNYQGQISILSALTDGEEEKPRNIAGFERYADSYGQLTTETILGAAILEPQEVRIGDTFDGNNDNLWFVNTSQVNPELIGFAQEDNKYEVLNILSAKELLESSELKVVLKFGNQEYHCNSIVLIDGESTKVLTIDELQSESKLPQGKFALVIEGEEGFRLIDSSNDSPPIEIAQISQKQ